MSSKFGQMHHWFPWEQIWLQCEKRRQYVFSNVFDRIHFNDDMHKSLNEFEVRRDPTTEYGVGCP